MKDCNIFKSDNKMKEKQPMKEIIKKAIIFDIDGTLAEMCDRSPYDWNKVGFDFIKMPVANVLNLYRKAGYKIIIFTGRDGVCELSTRAWLCQYGIKYDHFDIRKEKDNRCDSIVKKEMYDKIKDKYKIEAVYDDRDSVVKMWRELGLQCFQVNFGNF